MKTSPERALKNTSARPRSKWPWGCSIWRVILCHPAANYCLDSTGKPLLVSVPTWWRGTRSLESPKSWESLQIRDMWSQRWLQSRERNICSPGPAPCPGGFQEQTQTVHDPALQAGEEDMGRALAPAEDREASWQSSPGRIPGQRGADGRAFRALAGGIPGPLAEGTDLALLFLLLGHFLSVLLPLVGFLRRLCQSKEKQMVPGATCCRQLESPP